VLFGLDMEEKEIIPYLYALDGEIVEKILFLILSSFIFSSLIILSWSMSPLKDTKP